MKMWYNIITAKNPYHKDKTMDSNNYTIRQPLKIHKKHLKKSRINGKIVM